MHLLFHLCYYPQGDKKRNWGYIQQDFTPQVFLLALAQTSFLLSELHSFLHPGFDQAFWDSFHLEVKTM